jgi:hypothetical protein
MAENSATSSIDAISTERRYCQEKEFSCLEELQHLSMASCLT